MNLKTCIPTLMMILLSGGIYGQCVFADTLIVEDLSSTTAEIVVDGLFANDLSDPDQGLCSIKIHFKHDYVGDMTVSLTSPAGQTVNLIGPGVLNSNSTQFVTWNISMIPCDSTAMPDYPFLSDTYDNLQPWGNLNTYIGSYYPFSGCLEDYNTGPANGVWTVTASDVSGFADGLISYIELIFCDNTNVYCFECQAYGGTLNEVPNIYCEGDPDLNLDIDPDFLDSIPNADHVYSYLIVENDTIIGFNMEPDLTGLEFGEYQICGLSHLEAHVADLHDLAVAEALGVFTDLIESDTLCADLSSNCIDISILDVPDTLITTEVICFGDEIVINDVSYTETGLYVTNADASNCDTTFLLDLTVIEVQSVIIADTTSISCNYPNATLDLSQSIFSIDAITSWFSNDIDISEDDESASTLIISNPGIIGLSIVEGVCADTSYIEIFDDGSIPSFTFEVDTLTCDRPSVLIDLTISQEVETLSWSGPVSAGVEDILVGVPGTYYISATSSNGCTGVDSIEVIQDINVPIPQFIADTLTCIEDTAQITALLPGSFSYTYLWSGPGIAAEEINSNAPNVTLPGVYTLTLTSLHNGCVEVFDTEVSIDTFVYPVVIESDTLDCEVIEANLIAMSSDIDAMYTWSHEGNLLTGDTVIVNEGGIYHLDVLFSNGCSNSYLHVVQQDTLIPNVMLSEPIITCLVDSVQIVSSSPDVDISYAWSGPFEFESDEASPYVHHPGEYTATVTDANGCSTIATSNVSLGSGLPNLTFDYQDLDCNIGNTIIVPSDTTNLIFDWVDNGVQDTSEYKLFVDTPGHYYLGIMDSLTGCTATYDIHVMGDYEVPDISFTSDTLNCEVLSVDLQIESTLPVDIVRWSDSEGSFSDDLSPQFTEGGEYYLDLIAENGCSLLDTIMVIQDTLRPLIQVDASLISCEADVSNVLVNVTPNTSNIYMEDVIGEYVLGSAMTYDEPGIYEAYALLDNGCRDTIQFEVLLDTVAPVIAIATPETLACDQFSVDLISITNESPLTYQWTGPGIITANTSAEISVDQEGEYTVMVSDTAGCTEQTSIIVNTEIDFPEVNLLATEINCENANADIELITTSDVDQVQWSAPIEIDDNEYLVVTDVVGTYIAEVTGTNGCVTIDSVSVMIDTIAPEISAEVIGILDCNQDEVMLESTSSIDGSTFTWSSSAGTFDGNAIPVNVAGTYTLTVVAPNQCIATTEVIVEQDTVRPTIITGPNPILNCIEGKVTLSVETDSNVTEYHWEGPQGIFDEPEPFIILPGIYGVTVTNDLGCTASAEIEVIDDTQGPEISVRDTFVTCDLLPVPIPVSTTDPNISYLWVSDDYSSTEAMPQVSGLGQYVLYAQNTDNLCYTIDTMTVTYQEVPPIFDYVTEDIDCHTSSASLYTIETEDYLSAIWSNELYQFISEDTLETTTEGIYHLIVTGHNACEDTVAVEVTDLRVFPDVSVLLDEPFQCENVEVTLDGEVLPIENMIFEWTSIDGNIMAGVHSEEAFIQGEGTYVLSVTHEPSGCEVRDSIVLEIEEQSLVEFHLSGQDPKCLDYTDGSITLDSVNGGYPPFMLSIDGQAYVSTSMFDGLTTGSYNITIIDSLGCTLEQELTLGLGFDFEVQAQHDTLVIVGDTATLEAVFNVPYSDIFDVSWSADTYLYDCDNCVVADVAPLNNTIYTVIAETFDGCIDSSTVVVRVNRNPSISIANVFTPGRAPNDLFYVQQTSGIERVIELSVYDRWSSMMFHTKNVIPGDRSHGWDGTFNGQKVNPGVFVVMAELMLYSGEVVTYIGDLTLIR